MTFAEYSDYKDNINENWLFNSYEVAVDFAKYCNSINEIHPQCIESEYGWKPFTIYTFA